MKYYRNLGEALQQMNSEGVDPVLTSTHDPEKPGVDAHTPAAVPVLMKQATEGSEPVYDEAGDIVGYVKTGAQDVAKFAQSVAPEAQSIAQKFASLSTPGKVMVGLLAYAGLKKIF